MPLMTVTALPALRDNVVWLMATAPGAVAALDPGEAEPLLRHLDRHRLGLSHILITHHHHDHVGGVESLRRATGALVVGHQQDRHRLPSLDLAVADGQRLILGERSVTVIATPGHTSGHLVYQVEDALFVGDTLFRFGCGRLFEGSPAQMWSSLCKLRAFPDNTRLFPAHDYTLLNLPFALQLEPVSPRLLALRQELLLQADEARGPCPSLPVALGLERTVNPFLRCDDPALCQALGLDHLPPVDVFATLRERRNNF